MFDPTNINSGRKCQPTGQDVANWPEFQALMKRLGVPDANLGFVELRLDDPSKPVIVHVIFEAVDTTGKTYAPVPPMNFPDPKKE